MGTGIHPWVDCVFKRLFAVEENKDMLLSMINAALEEGKESKVVEIEILNPYNIQDFLGDKLSIVDIKAKNDKGEQFLIEIQVKMYDSFPKRLLYYWAKNYYAQLEEREDYDKLHKVTIIAFLVEPIKIVTEDYYNLYKVLNFRKNNVVFCDDLKIVTVELSKFQTKEQAMTEMEKWTYFLKYGDTLEEDKLPAAMQTPEIFKAVKELKKFSYDDRQRAIYDSRIMAIRDERTKLADEYKKGLMEGKIEGKIEGEIKGKIEGEIKGKIEGKIEGIEGLLEARFGARGLHSMKQIRSIQDLERLNKIFLLAKTSPSLDSFESELVSLL